MANPTTNFNWQMPTSSDLVTDLPADFETFGQAVDTTFVDLKGGTTGQVLSKASNTDMDFTWTAIDPLVILDAKGDLITATAADTPARLAVGTNGQVLTADSTASTGLVWSSPSSGGMTLLSTTTLTTGTTTISTISGSYKNLLVLAKGIYCSTNTDLRIRLNSDTGSNYSFVLAQGDGSSAFSGSYSGTSMEVGVLTTGRGNVIAQIMDYSATDKHKIVLARGDQAADRTRMTAGRWANTSAITTVKVMTNANQMASGSTISLYGVIA